MMLDWLVWYYARALELPFPVLRTLLTHGLPITRVKIDDRLELHVLGYRHCPYGPALEWADGTKAWYRNGQLHRDDGPAFYAVDGYKAWWRNGQRHRDEGSAVERSNGSNEYWRNGVQYWPSEQK